MHLQMLLLAATPAGMSVRVRRIMRHDHVHGAHSSVGQQQCSAAIAPAVATGCRCCIWRVFVWPKHCVGSIVLAAMEVARPQFQRRVVLVIVGEHDRHLDAVGARVHVGGRRQPELRGGSRVVMMVVRREFVLLVGVPSA